MSPRPAEPAVRRYLAPSRRRRLPTRGALLRRRIAIGVAKVLLPAAALILLTTIAFWSELDGNGDNNRVSFRRTVEPRGEALRVVAPRYRGVDELGRPYTITATVAEQVGAEEVLDLREPRGDIVLTDGGWVFLRADDGRFEKASQRLTLNGDVTIYLDSGTMLHTSEAVALLREGTAEGDTAVAAQGGFGTLTAEGFRLTERGAVVMFTGRARAVLESRP